ncbi:Reverse transcriptase (RNA-dependent DNA polymerase) [Fragilaria crotonensis]|nr:Reverse transcriptase (RNA-dependent DNA polymerase) [Fragilaria crotonensis]
MNETAVTMQIGRDGRLPRTWILLDNQSTVDVFCNRELLSNIREHESTMDIHCNAGITSTKLIGELQGYGTVWYNPKGIANILSLSRVKERGYRVTFDSSDGNAFHLHKSDGGVRIFTQSDKGLYYLDTQEDTTGVSLVNTVADKATKYSERDYSKAKLARSIQKIIGRPSTRTFISIVEKNQLPNCPVTRDDIIAAERIFGPDLGSLKGKTVHKRPDPVKIDHANIPGSVVSRYRNVVLAGDIMFVNKLPFFVTISRHIKFGTSELLTNRKIETIFEATKRVYQQYMKRGFKITSILMDGEFDTGGYRGELSALGITLNVVAAEEHVPEIERHIRVIKERARSVINTLPFDKVPARVIIELVYYCGFWLNSFPAAGGISDTMSPRAIVVGTTVNYANHCKVEFGEYVQTHEPHDNSMQSRTVGALAASYRKRPRRTLFLQPRHRTATQPQPLDIAPYARRRVPFDDDDLQDDDIYDGDNDNADDDDYNPNEDDNVEIAGVDDEGSDDEEVHDDDNDDDADDDDNDDQNDDDQNDQNDHIANLANTGGAPETFEPVEPTEIGPIEPVEPVEIEPVEHTIEEQMDEAYGPRNSEYNLRPRKPRDYGHIHTILESTAMTQHSVKKGLRLFGDKGVDAVMKELDQLHVRKVLKPTKNLNCKERRDALQYLMFLKEKRNGIIKARGCADGRKQRAFTTKEEASSPTVSIESVMLSCVIDAKERRDVATVDLPGAFMQADMEDTVHMKLEGKMAELLVKCDPKLYRVVTDVIELLKSEFGNEAPLTITRGKVHEYLGMTIDFSIDGKVMFKMFDYIKTMLDELPADFGGTAPNPASMKLFDVDPAAARISKSWENCSITIPPSCYFSVSELDRMYNHQRLSCALE